MKSLVFLLPVREKVPSIRSSTLATTVMDVLQSAASKRKAAPGRERLRLWTAVSDLPGLSGLRAALMLTPDHEVRSHQSSAAARIAICRGA